MSSPKLRSLSRATIGEQCKALVILVPGTGTPEPPDWTVIEQHKHSTELHFLLYQHSLSLSNSFTWSKLLELGLPLVEQLIALQGKSRAEWRPLLFVCHSFGGIIVKQVFQTTTLIEPRIAASLTSKALCIAKSQSHYHAIVDTTFAVGFFGSPHGAEDENLLSERSQLIVRALAPNISRKCLTALGDECWQLRDILLLFTDLDFKISFLSVYETLETKVKSGQIVKRSRQVLLVDKQVATLHARTEHVIGIESDHPGLCTFSDPHGKSKAFGEIRAWFDESFETSLTLLSTTQVVNDHSHTVLNPGTVFTNADQGIETESSLSFEEVTARMPRQLSISTESEVVVQPQDMDAQDSTDPIAGSSTGLGYELIPVASQFQTAMKAASLPCFLVDSRLYNREFWGRENILQVLDEALAPKATVSSESAQGFARPAHFTLCGHGGLGKSEIAINYVFTRREKYDAVFWVRADDAGKLEEDFGNIAKQLGLEDEKLSKNPVASRELAKGWLSNPKKLVRSRTDIVGQAEASWLIVFDNADDSEILEEYWPIFGGGAILMTSRDPSAKDRLGAGGSSMDMRPLTKIQGASLFKKLAHRPDGDELLAQEISEELGGLPLAIAQMAGIVHHQQLGLAEFLGRYRDWSERSEMYAYSVGGRLNLRRGTIASVFALDHLEPIAQTLLQLCSVLDPDCIQERLFDNYATKSGKLDGFPSRSFQYASARTELLRCSLIQRNQENKEFALHRLVQDAVRATLSIERRKLLLQSAIDLLSAAWGQPKSIEGTSKKFGPTEKRCIRMF